MSRVRAGDLAIIKCHAPASLNQRIVEVVSAAPHDHFTLPDGSLANASGYTEPLWVVKFVGGPGPCPWSDGRERPAPYAIAPDWCLYPLPGDPDTIDERETDEVSA